MQSATERDDQSAEQLRRGYVARVIVELFPDGPSEGQYRALLDVATRAAVATALESGRSLEDIEDTVLPEADDLVREISWIVRPVDDRKLRGARQDLWTHRNDLSDEIRRGEIPQINRAQVEEATAFYLNLSWRVPEIDRVLADLLIAVEVSDYAQKMLIDAWKYPELSDSPFVQKGVFWPSAKRILIAAIVGFGTFLVTAWSGSGWALVAGGLVVVACLVWIVAILVHTPLEWRRRERQRGQITSLFEAMLRCYRQLSSPGPVSARHVRGTCEQAADEGVVWPGPLFSLLDDIERRSGRF